MKKALVFLLILAVAGGLFAQGWSFGAGGSSGIHFVDDKVKVDGDTFSDDHFIGLQNADGDAYGSGTISATYEGTEGGKFVLKLGTGSIEAALDLGDESLGFSGYLINKFLTDSISGTVSTRPDWAYAWATTFGGVWKIYGGIFSGDGDDGAVADFQYAANENLGIINVFKPLSDIDLTIGFGIGDNRDLTDGDDFQTIFGGPNWNTPGNDGNLGDFYFPIGITFVQPETFQLKLGYQTVPSLKGANADDSLYAGLDLLLLSPVKVGVSVELNQLEEYGDIGTTTIAEYIEGTALDGDALSYKLTLEERLNNAPDSDLEFLAYANVAYAISDFGGGTLTPALNIFFGYGAGYNAARASSGDFETSYDHDWAVDTWSGDFLGFGIRPSLTFAVEKASFTLAYGLGLTSNDSGPVKVTALNHNLYFLVDIAF
ncbi:hypothetical protein [Leadbettera azotonutricia]|uniref:Porin n=1 Tax=Leadbettera azotonutricia (strain ATCC BAA-888 / DSM 13862 / ZAS-9) TaxID=545695 RepID=F5YG29_LEAAZ|nr:hypothetical protein [Leadbettera azotonutricia]AEF81626.1 hypothetical protein TREAZ_1275 [Leadbettera azotonutricia ZAS-9]